MTDTFFSELGILMQPCPTFRVSPGAQHSTAQHSTAQNSTARYSPAQSPLHKAANQVRTCRSERDNASMQTELARANMSCCAVPCCAFSFVHIKISM